MLNCCVSHLCYLACVRLRGWCEEGRVAGYVALQRPIKAEIKTVVCKHPRTTETIFDDIIDAVMQECLVWDGDALLVKSCCCMLATACWVYRTFGVSDWNGLKRNERVDVFCFFQPLCFDKGKNWLMCSPLWVASLCNILLQKQVIRFSQCHVFKPQCLAVKCSTFIQQRSTTDDHIPLMYWRIHTVLFTNTLHMPGGVKATLLSHVFSPPSRRKMWATCSSGWRRSWRPSRGSLMCSRWSHGGE